MTTKTLGTTKTVHDHERMTCEFAVGDEVWNKPPRARCTTNWKPGVVTGIVSKYNAEIDRVHRHVRDISKKLANNCNKRREGVVSEPLLSHDPDFKMEVSEPSEGGAGTDENVLTSCVRRVARKRQLQARFNDFFCEL